MPLIFSVDSAMVPHISSILERNGKNKTAAALLAVFLGGFGAHKFYLGKIGLGFLYLIFFWRLIPAFIEFILLLTMSDETFNQKYDNS